MNVDRFLESLINEEEANGSSKVAKSLMLLRKKAQIAPFNEEQLASEIFDIYFEHGLSLLGMES